MQRFGLFVNRKNLMARREVEDSTFANLPDTVAAEMIALVRVLFEDNRVRRRNVEGFVVHFRLADIPPCGQPGGDGMLPQECCHMRRRTVRAVGGENTLGERKSP
jgi:hypothetical protein